VSTQSALRAMGLALAFAGCAQPAPQLASPPVPVTPPAPAAAEVPPPLEIAAPAEAPVVVKETRPQAEEAERLLSFFERLKRLQGAELAREHEAARLAYGRAASEYNRIGYAMTLSLPGTAFNDDARALELLNPLLKKSENGLRPLVVLLTTFVQERRRLGGDLAAVQQKLDALKSLERTLIEREQNNQGRK
jgi:hypothetical protein